VSNGTAPARKHLRRWVESHLTEPREITAWSDVDGRPKIQLSFFGDHLLIVVFNRSASVASAS